MGINGEALATAMGEALRCAREAERNADVPVGAVMLDRDGAIAARSYNRREQKGDPLSHAEIEVIRAAAAVNGSWNLAEFTLVVTLEPCPMCAGAAVSAHVGSIVFGAWDPKMGACGSVWDIPRDPHIGTHPQASSRQSRPTGLTLLSFVSCHARTGKVTFRIVSSAYIVAEGKQCKMLMRANYTVYPPQAGTP